MQGHYNSEVDLLLENEQWYSDHSVAVVKQQIMERSMEDGKEESAKEIADRSNGGYFLSLMAIFSVVALLGFIAYILYNDDCKL